MQNYSYINAPGFPGLIRDLSPKEVLARIADSDMKFGIGVVIGENPGKSVAKPTVSSTADQFEGVVLNHTTVENGMDGTVVAKKGITLSIMRYGSAWVRVEDGVEPSYGDALKLLVSGDNAGCFTTEESAGTTIDIPGRFVGAVTGGIAPIELNNSAVASAGA